MRRRTKIKKWLVKKVKSKEPRFKKDETHLVKNNLFLGNSHSDWSNLSPVERNGKGRGRE
jgi:hypothetical protein